MMGRIHYMELKAFSLLSHLAASVENPLHGVERNLGSEAMVVPEKEAVVVIRFEPACTRLDTSKLYENLLFVNETAEPRGLPLTLTRQLEPGQPLMVTV